ncbi:MAG: anthranilate phosphoribosyltransferase [Spirochaetes bacterium]|nr:anthranilate phosphoribosyltransferase [Spirochaetota bacterium]
MNTGQLIAHTIEGNPLSIEQSEFLFDSIFDGKLSDVELAAVLAAMKVRREKPQEICGAIKSMRKFALSLPITENVFDTCGTGGDHSHSFNISSAVAIILNAMGYSIAKHGNRSMTSKSGSADFYEALHIPVHLTGEDAERYFEKHKFIFLFAPNYHPAMKYAAPVRKKLGVRTIFNYLGPLTNPLKPKRQMIGIFHPSFLEVYSEAALPLGYERLVLYSSTNGMDEVSPLYPTAVIDIQDTNSRSFTIIPEKFINTHEAHAIPKDLTPQENASLFVETITAKSPTPLSKLLALNTALALYVLDYSASIEKNFNTAIEVIHSGCVAHTLSKLQEV